MNGKEVQVAESCWFTPTHEWIRQEGDALRIGITTHAAQALGDLVYVELPEPGRQVATGEAMAVVESVKAASDVYSPVSGEVLEVNTTLIDHPELVNEDPMGQGWLLRIYPLGPLENLLDQAGYDALLQSQAQS